MRFEATTARLRLRRPVEADLDFHIALHSDPRLYTHAPHALKVAREDNEEFFRSVLDHWDRHGFGYWTVEDLEAGAPIGMAGVRKDDGYLNLYYRLSLEAHRRGYAREAAREAVALATEWLPGMPVRAFAREHNTASVRTAEAAGLAAVGPFSHRDDPPGEPPSVMLESPTVARVEQVPDREEVLDLWCRVNDAGGSVGFLPGADRDDVSSALTRHESDMSAGLAVLGELRDPAGGLLGLGWWVRSPSPLMEHGLWLYRLMVDPRRQGRNLGRILLAGLHRIAREIPGVDLVALDYRSGHGLGGFYERCGYTEVGRIPGAVRVGPGDDRDDVFMSMRLDGGPLRFDSRT
jgi:RimJ/RimL family protein N-acetyltransferase